MSPARLPPYFVKNLDEPFHPGGNSLCYALQFALLMEADPIYLMGFTLVSGGGYEFGRDNPVKKAGRSRPAFYDVERAMEWLREVEKKWPGRVRLLPGWSGPLQDLFSIEPMPRVKQDRFDEKQAEEAKEAKALPELNAGPLPPIIPDERPARPKRSRVPRGHGQDAKPSSYSKDLRGRA
jgi:hypothetical protein